MDLTEIKKQVVKVLQSISSLDANGRIDAVKFLIDCANDFGLVIPEKQKLDKEISKNNARDSLNLSFPSNSNEDSSLTLSKSESEINLSFKNLVEIEMGSDLNKQLSVQRSSVDNNDIIRPSFNDSVNESTNLSVDKESHAVENTKVRKTKRILKESQTKKIDHIKQLEPNNLESNSKPRRYVKKSLKVQEDQENKNEVFKCPGCTVTCENKGALLQHFNTHAKAPMSCRLCRSNFNNILNFWKHKKKQECQLSLFKCAECGEKFKYRRHYLKHILGHNDNNCRYCDEKFSTWIHYKHHLKKKHPDIKMERDLIPCKFCAMSFRRHLGLYNHYRIKHSKGKFVCLSCGLLLPTKEKYKEHVLVHESEKSWKCKICKMKFYRRQQLLFHVSVHKSGTYKCLTCDITVTSKMDLYKHKKEGHEVKGLEPKFECDICHKNFEKKVVLKNHMATHSKEKKYHCKYCVKSFSTLDALQKHQKRKSHFEKAKIILPESKYEKVYEDKLICESCGKQYKTQRELTWHLRVHKSTYECDECGKTFTLKINLTKHIKLHRNKVCVVCELCGNTFNQLSALNEHNLMKHSDVRNAECEVCKKKFKRKSELNRHMRIHKQKRPFACFCGTAFRQSSHLQTHYKNFHEKANGQSHLLGSGNFASNQTSGVFSDTLINTRKQMYVNGEQETLLPIGNVVQETEYRSSAAPYNNIQVNENHVAKEPYLSNYGIRYPQNVMDPMNVSYEELHFGAPQSDKRELTFSSPAVDLSMVAITDVVQNEITLEGHRDITESVVEPFNKLPDDTSNIHLVNLSEHIVQEYLLNLP